MEDLPPKDVNFRPESIIIEKTLEESKSIKQDGDTEEQKKREETNEEQKLQMTSEIQGLQSGENGTQLVGDFLSQTIDSSVVANRQIENMTFAAPIQPRQSSVIAQPSALRFGADNEESASNLNSQRLMNVPVSHQSEVFPNQSMDQSSFDQNRLPNHGIESQPLSSSLATMNMVAAVQNKLESPAPQRKTAIEFNDLQHQSKSAAAGQDQQFIVSNQEHQMPISVKQKPKSSITKLITKQSTGKIGPVVQKDNVFKLQDQADQEHLKTMPVDQKRTNANQYVEVQVYTQNKEDCQWGIFDFQNVRIDANSGKVIKKKNDADDEENDGRSTNNNYEHCQFKVQGTCYITRQSKYTMTSVKPSESSDNQVSMGSLSIIQNPDSYYFYQNADLKHDFTKQVKRQDDHISQQLKELSKKSFMVVASCNSLGNFHESKGVSSSSKVLKRGSIIRGGDIIKFGRVPIMIKESSIDANKYKAIRRDHQINGLGDFRQKEKVESILENSIDDMPEENSQVYRTIGTDKPILMNESCVNTSINGNMRGQDDQSQMNNLYMLQSQSSINEPDLVGRRPLPNPNRDIMHMSAASPNVNINRASMLHNSATDPHRINSSIQRNQANKLLSSGLEIIKEEYKLNNKHINQINSADFGAKKSTKSKKLHKSTCRICLCEESEIKDDPIVSPCHCKGYSGDIHIKCLQEWLNSKRKVNKLSPFQENYIYKKSQCEVCGSLYPDMVDVKGKMYPIFDFSKPKRNNYIVIEVLGMPAGKNFSVVKIPDDYQLEVGRSNAELCIPDVSVSKKQATLKFDLAVGELVLQDSNSKYGTHILIQRPIELILKKPVYMINGLSLISLHLKNKGMGSLCSCLLPKNNLKYLSEKQQLYDEVKEYMPGDLIKYKTLVESDPSYIDFFDSKKFKQCSVHAMRLNEHSYYLKNMLEQIETDGEGTESDQPSEPQETPLAKIIETGDSQKGIMSGAGAIARDPNAEIKKLQEKQKLKYQMQQQVLESGLQFDSPEQNDPTNSDFGTAQQPHPAAPIVSPYQNTNQENNSNQALSFINPIELQSVSQYQNIGDGFKQKEVMNTSIQEGITHQDKGSDVIKDKTIEDSQFKLYNAGVQNSRNDFEANKAFVPKNTIPTLEEQSIEESYNNDVEGVIGNNTTDNRIANDIDRLPQSAYGKMFQTAVEGNVQGPQQPDLTTISKEEEPNAKSESEKIQPHNNNKPQSLEESNTAKPEKEKSASQSSSDGDGSGQSGGESSSNGSQEQARQDCRDNNSSSPSPSVQSSSIKNKE